MDYGNWLKWQIDYLLYLQNFRDVSHHILDKFFIYITLFGEITVPIILICTLYWCINKRVGQFVIFTWLASFMLNIMAKVTACIYRPWVLDCRVHPVPQAIPAATGYSFPSGHTAGVTSVWGSLAVAYWNKKWLRYLCFFIIPAVMISRNYLGVHTPQDVVVSFFISVFIIWGMYNIFKWLDNDVKNGNRDLVLAFCMIFLITLTMCYMWFKSYPIDYLCGKILYDPCSMKHLELTRSGFFFGAVIGWLIERRFIGFDSQIGSLKNKIIRAVIGIIVVFALHSAIPVIKSAGGCLAYAGMFVQLMIIGLFITCIYPFLIKRFNA